MSTTVNRTVLQQSTQSSIYDFLFKDLADTRTNSWLLVKDPGPPLLIIGAWLYFVLKAGPNWMKNRQPMQLRKTIIVYNFVQVFFSTYIFIRGGQLGWFGKYSFICEPVDFSDNAEAIEIAKVCHFYYMVKLTELLDTVFFVLRKKNRQITFLHLYHHTVMPMVSWGCTKYYPGGHATFIGFINSFIHIVMYSYYALAAFGPGMQKYLWWKKYITTMQMIQFGMVFVHNSQLFYRDCGYPKWVALLTVPNAVLFFQLFNQFYKDNYRKSQNNELNASDVSKHKSKKE